MRPFAACLAVLSVAVARADSPEAVLKRADELFAADRPAAAEPEYRSLLDSPVVYARRKAYDRLMALYVKSGRQDKAVQLARPFADWLRQAGDAAGLAELDLQVGDCLLALGHYDRADERYVAALAARPPLPVGRRLQALRGRADAAGQRRHPSAADRWAELEAAAAAAGRTADELRDNRTRVIAARHLADALDRRGKGDEALAVLAPLPEVHDKLNDPIGRRDTQRQRANLLAARGRFDDAVPLFRDALDLQRTHRPNDRMAAGDILAEWAAAADAAGRRAEAGKLRDEAAGEFRAVMDRPTGTEAEGGPLAAFAKLQSLTRSARQFRKALEINETAGRRWSGDELLASRLSADRGGLELVSAAYRAARAHLKESLARLDAADPPDLRALPKVLVNLATAELAGETPQAAGPLLDRCAELYRTHRLPDDPVRAECDYLRGAAAAQRGEFTAAVAHFRAGLARCDAAGPAADPVRFNLWLNTALVHKEQADGPAALDALTKSADVLARFADRDDLNFGLIDAVRADLHLADGRLADAVALRRRLAAACDRHGLAAGYLWATAQELDALAAFTRNDLAAAEAVWTKLADVQRAGRQPLLGRTLNRLGMVAEKQGRRADAVRLFEEAKAFADARPGSAVQTRATTLWRLAVLADEAGDRAKATALLNEVFDLADQARLTTFGEAAQRAAFFAQFTPMFEQAADWAARDGDGERLLVVAARSRSRTLLDRVLAAGLAPQDGIPAADRDRLLKREADARQAASRVRAKLQLLAPADADGPAGKALVAELEAARKEYADAWREIVNADPLTRSLTAPRFAEQSVEAIRTRVVGPKTAVLTYVIGRRASYAVLAHAGGKAEVFPLATTEAVVRRLAGPPPTAGEAVASASLRGIVLSAAPQPERPADQPAAGPAVPLTDRAAGRLIDAYLAQVRNPGFVPTRGITLSGRGPAGPPAVAGPEAVGDAVLPPPLLRRLREVGAETLVLIPDGPLHKLPIESLVVSSPAGPRFALDELPAVCTVPSAAVLATALARPAAKDPAATLLTVADPAYTTVSAPAAARLATREATVFGSLDRLPGTAEESRRVRAAFPPAAITALAGPDATERKVVAALPGKRFVHLAAHGFADERFGGLYAAVALTPPAGADPPPDDDGFLSLPEIYRLDLSGCELTVLSACVTNVGPQRPLEAGVTLAGAFLSAGSRRVVASCWAVSDRATADLMGEFFATVRRDGGRASYPAAMKAARQRLKADPETAAPFYWAPFVLVGVPE